LNWRNWVAAISMSALFFLVCHGGLSWAAQHVPSGVSALLMSSISLWTALLELALRTSSRPNWRMLAALFIGFIGMVLLVLRPEVLAGSKVGSMGAVVVLAGAFSWALGTVLTRRMPLPQSPILVWGMQMMSGGVLLLLAGIATGQAQRFTLAQVSSASVWSMAFLTLIGSLVGFTCYIYLAERIHADKGSNIRLREPYCRVVHGLDCGWRTPEYVVFGCQRSGRRGRRNRDFE
jgi:drug/metabolite transporter (DMT)-like permease